MQNEFLALEDVIKHNDQA